MEFKIPKMLVGDEGKRKGEKDLGQESEEEERKGGT